MSKETAKSLAELIGSDDSSLGNLAGEARRRSTLSEHLRKGLADPLGTNLVHCNINSENTITLLAASPEWAARLRYEAPAILELAQQIEPKVMQVKVRVANG
jgi:hypothetical protein